MWLSFSRTELSYAYMGVLVPATADILFQMLCVLFSVTALYLATLWIPSILYMPSTSHERYLQGVAWWYSGCRKTPQQVSEHVFLWPDAVASTSSATHLHNGRRLCFLLNISARSVWLSSRPAGRSRIELESENRLCTRKYWAFILIQVCRKTPGHFLSTYEQRLHNKNI